MKRRHYIVDTIQVSRCLVLDNDCDCNRFCGFMAFLIRLEFESPIIDTRHADGPVDEPGWW